MNTQKQQTQQKRNQRQKEIRSVEQKFSNIEKYDLLNLSCSLKRYVELFFEEYQKKEKIKICFITKVVKCTRTNNFFLTFQLFKDIDESKRNYNYDMKSIKNKLINELKRQYKNNDVTFFLLIFLEK